LAPPPSLILRQLRTAGPRWAYRRLKREWSMPTTAWGRAFYRLRNPAAQNSRTAPAAARDTLFAFYDLGLAPITFDFLWFLVAADIVRRRHGLRQTHIVIVPGPINGFRDENPEYNAAIDQTMRQARVRNILIPACALLRSASGVTLASTRAQAADIVALAREQVFPAGYTPATPLHEGPRAALDAARDSQAEIAVLRAPADAMQAVERWLAPRLGQRRLLTITLRQHAYLPDRNSNIDAWSSFARTATAEGYFPVVIPDTEQASPLPPEAFDSASVYPEAAWNLGLRSALYERAYLNLGVNNGPMGLCWLDGRTRYLTFKILTKSSAQTSKRYMEYLGFVEGRSLPFADQTQRWVWEPDDPQIIAREFAAMVEEIDKKSR
jgi:hypothetical protein